MLNQLSLPVIYAIILIEGFVTISLEILSIRQLVPFVGNNVVVTSLIIGVFLLFLAQGYQAGGQVRSNYGARLIRNFLMAALLIGFGLSFTVIEMYFTLGSALFKNSILLVLTSYLLLVVAPSVYLLGQTVPITMHLRDNGATAGSIGGNVLHLSTIGSFLGAVLTSLVCMRYLGVAQTVLFNYICLFILIALIAFKMKEHYMYVVLSLFILVPVYIFNVSFERAHFVGTTNYGNYQIKKTNQFYETEGTALIINNSYSSYNNELEQGFPYVEKIRSILTDLNLQGKEILVLGAGGFVIGANDPHNQYTYVDIDNYLPEIIKESNFVKKINGSIIIKDARQFLLSTEKKYDVIILDAFSHMRSIPAHLTTYAFYDLVKSHLTLEGFVIANLIMDPWLSTTFAQNMDNTLRHVFGHCSHNPLHFKKGMANNLYVCKPMQNRSQRVYLDNNNVNEFEIFNHH